MQLNLTKKGSIIYLNVNFFKIIKYSSKNFEKKFGDFKLNNPKKEIKAYV
jgi:hypothetical protein